MACASLLAVAVCAVLAGATMFAAIGDWAADLDPPPGAGWGSGAGVPAGTALWRFLRYLLMSGIRSGVARIAPDYYDCMIGPLLVRLRAGAGRAEINEYLWFELGDHFGLGPARHDVDAVANRLVAWWARGDQADLDAAVTAASRLVDNAAGLDQETHDLVRVALDKPWQLFTDDPS
jgi:hypothetical protein